MKKHFLYLLIFPIIGFHFSTQAQTIIAGGDVSGTWTTAGSPYIIEASVTVAENDTLIILPGVEVMFNPGFNSLRVNQGETLIAEGTVDSLILFSSNSPNPAPGDWNNIYLNGTGYGSILKYCRIEYSKHGVHCRAWVDGCDDADNFSIIEHCEIRNISNIGLWVEGDGDAGDGCVPSKTGVSSPIIRHNKIYNNQSWGIYMVAWDGFLANGLVRAEISNNQIFNNGNDGIRTLWNDPVLPKITNNTFYNNGGPAIHILSNTDSMDYIIENNIIVNNDEGIRSGNNNPPIIRYNDVWQNTNGNYINFNPTATDISADPLFIDPDNDDFSLHCLSPCIDAGNPDSPPDPDGSVADIGALWFDFSQLPGSANSNAPICEGEDLLLMASGGINYVWTGENGFSSTDQNPVISTATSNQSGVYTVTITNSDGCIFTRTTTVQINPLPTALIEGSLEFCAGDSTTIMASGGTDFLWNTGDTSAIITVNMMGDYIVTVTDNNGCTDSDTAAVVENTLPTASIEGDLEFCAGDSTTLTANGGTDFLWSTGETSASIVVNAAGAYQVVVTDSNGCVDSDSVDVVENPLPTASIVGDLEFCVGDSTTLTASGGTEFLWSTGEASTSIVVNSTDDYQVTVTDSNGCTDSDAVAVVENPLPTVSIEGEMEFCEGDSTTLTASGGTDFIWSTGETSASIIVQAEDDYSVTVTDENTCSSAAFISIIVHPLPTAMIEGQLDFCEGDSTMLTATGGSAFIWSTGETSPDISVNTGSDYSVTVTDGNGCTDTDTVFTIMNDLPLVDFILAEDQDTFCITDPAVALTGGSPENGTYSGPGIVANVFNPAEAGAGEHIITYTYEDPVTSCINSASQTIIVIDGDCTTAINSLDHKRSFTIFPNPSSGNFTVKLEGWIGDTELHIFNMQGQRIYSKIESTKQFDITGFSAGIYLVKISSQEFSAVQKVIVQ